MTELTATARAALDALRAAGATRASCTASRGKTTEFNFADGEFTLLRTLHDDALALTGFLGGKKGTIGLNRFDGEAIAQAARDCMAAAENAEDDPAWELAAEGGGSFTDGAPEVEVDRFFDRCRELIATIAEKHPSLLVEQLILCHEGARTVYENTNGVHYERASGSYHVYLSVCARDGEDFSAMSGTGFVTASLDQPLYECGTLARDLALAEKQARTTPYAGKAVLPVVIAPDCLNMLLYSLFENFCGDAAILSGTSAWRERLGEQVADPAITITAAAQHPLVVHGERWTGEGFAAENYDLLREGRLASFQLSQYVANRMGLSRAKNSGTSYVMAPGELTLDELLEKVGNGLYVGRFSGGQPAANGDFSGVAKNSFLIENGRLGAPVSEVMISGNLTEVLRDVIGITRERAEDGDTALPWLACGGITVSGK